MGIDPSQINGRNMMIEITSHSFQLSFIHISNIPLGDWYMEEWAMAIMSACRNGGISIHCRGQCRWQNAKKRIKWMEGRNGGGGIRLWKAV